MEQITEAMQATTLNHHSGTHLASGDVVGEYILVRRLGSGRFAVVWQAIERTGGHVALKIYKPAGINDKYFRNEIRACRGLGRAPCPQLVKHRGEFIHISAADDAAIYPCIVFDMQGESVSKLIHRLRDIGDIPHHIIRRIMQDLLRGLAHMHAAGYIHTDIKPGNLLLNQSVDELIAGGKPLCVTIADFGSSTRADNIFSHHVGTAQYCAPELVIGEPVTEACDIWAAFITCFELITGDNLFDIYDECDMDYGVDDAPDNGMIASDDDDMSTASERSERGERGERGERSETDSDWSGTDSEARDMLNYYHLYLMERVIGPAPADFAQCAANYYNKRGKLKNHPDLEPIGIAALMHSNYVMEPPECETIAEFLQQGLTYIPSARCTAEAALAHPWMNA